MNRCFSRSAIAIALCLVLGLCSFAEGSSDDVQDIVSSPVPSVGEVLRRYPDSETPGGDGAVTEEFRGLADVDIHVLTAYFGGPEAVSDDGTVTFSVPANGAEVDFVFDPSAGTVLATYPKDLRDEWTENARLRCEKAAELSGKGKYGEALEELLLIPAYRAYAPAAALLTEYPDLAAAVSEYEEKLKPYATAGNVVTFGAYPQTAEGTDLTPIEWSVLDVRGDRALLLSCYGLDEMPYNTEYDGVTWEDSDIRAWLNGEFLDRAFDTAEREAIVTSFVPNGRAQGYTEWADGGNDTNDKVFLLSYAEAHRYLDVQFGGKNTGSRVAPTEYAMYKGAWTNSEKKQKTTSDGDAATAWWLRSPGPDLIYASIVRSRGSLYYSVVPTANRVVRPAVWIDLTSGVFLTRP